MTKMLVKLNSPNQAEALVRTVNKYDYDADIRYGSCLVDAKSIMGVMTLAVGKVVELLVHTEENQCRELQQFVNSLSA